MEFYAMTIVAVLLLLYRHVITTTVCRPYTVSIYRVGCTVT